MKYTFLKIFATLALLMTSTLAGAQDITATLLDRESGETLPYATVSVIPEGSTKVMKFVLSDAEGKVRLQGVRKGAYKFKVELMGYKTYQQNIKMGAETMALGIIMIDQDKQVLDAAKVTDIGNPIIVKKDTIEYNASSFKTSDNDMLIDLLKKLPGIEVESDGSITANGETIKKITIDGKTFFLDDPQLASKNIPSKIVEKVKVVEKKSDQAMFTGIDDGEEETVIDLGIRKGMINGWFGNIMAGGGHDVPNPGVNDMNDWRWQGAGFIGNFSDKRQISIIINANNTNNRGFNDLAGSMMGNMRGGGGRGMGRGAHDAGITTSWMGGVNGAWTLLDNRMDIAGNYLYNGSRKLLEEESIKNTYISDNEQLNYHTTGTNNTFSNGHRLGMRLEHKFSENTSILFEPQFNIGNGNFMEYSGFDTDNEIRTPDGKTSRNWVNDGFNNNTGSNRNWTASGWGLIRQRLGKPGRTLTVNFRYNFSNNGLNGYNQSLTRSLEDADTISTTINQFFRQTSDNKQLTGRVTYTEPIWQDLFLEANYSYTWREQNSNKNTFDVKDNTPYFDASGNLQLPTQPISDKRDEVYSRDIMNLSRAQRAGLNFMYQKKKIRAQIGMSANPTYTYNRTSSREKAYTSNIVNWAPQASLNYDFSDNSNIRFFYMGHSEQPGTSQLVPVPDNSDPMNISLGNPGLKPYFNHRIRGMFRYTDKNTFTSINAFFDGGVVENNIINTTWYDNAGAQFSLPVNGPTSGNAGIRIMLNAPFGKSGFSVFNMINARYNNSSNYVAKGMIDMSGYYIGGDKFNFDYDGFLNDFNDHLRDEQFNLNNIQTMTLMERIRFTYRNDYVEVTAGGRTRVNKSWYTVSKAVPTTWNNQIDASMNWTIPGGINIISDFRYNWYRGYTTDQPSTAILNAEITKLLFKNKVTLAIKGYDLLAQARSLSVSDTANYHSETRNNTLGRYIILSVTYRFGDFGDFRKAMQGGGHGHGGRGRR